MITHVSVYMYCVNNAPPFAAIDRNGKRLRFYHLTRASAWRLAEACQRLQGRLSVGGQGWRWTRTPNPGYSEGRLDCGTPLIE